MPQYLVAIHHPDGYDGSLEGEEMMRDIDALNEEMQPAGARLFAGGLRPVSDARSLRKQPDGKVVDGPYRRLRSTSASAAFGSWRPLTWKRRCRGDARPSSPVAPVEVRPFFDMGPDEGGNRTESK